MKAKPAGTPPKTAAKKGVAEGEKATNRASDAREDAGAEAEKAKKTAAQHEAKQDSAAGAQSAQGAEAGEAAQNAEAADAQSAQEEEPDAKYMRLAADFQNYKRRVEKEKSEVYAYANEKFAVDLLGVLDNFERALEAQGDAAAQEEGFVKGMELIFRQLQDILQKNGVEEIQSLGEEFDPAIHNAVMMEATEAHESGKVSAVLNKGYRLRDRVIRPAMVKVAQ
jgi:molecular chaperone GrpE